MPAQFPNPDSVTATPQPTPFDSLLAQCRDLASERLSLALSGMLDKVDDALSALISETRDVNVQKLYSQTRDKALAQREAIEKQFRARYLREFQQRSNKVKKIGDSFADIDLSSLELELVGDEDLDETIKFNALAARLRQYCDEELIALDQRVGVLIGDASLQTDDNPFTPQAICDAYKDTCRQLDSNVEVRMVLLRLFDDHVVDEIRAVYKAVNALLIQNSILPKIRLSARKEPGKPLTSTKAAGEAPKATAKAEQKAPEGEQDLFSILKNLRASSMPPAGAAGATGTPVAGAAGAAAGATVLQGTELLGLLTRIQLGDTSAVPGNILPMGSPAGEPGMANVLRGLKETSVGAGMNQLDVMTLDIMSLVFDQLFDDPKIPVGVKGLIGRLQIPMLKVAIADKTFFSKKTHPARQLLDTLGEISLRLPPDFNASSPLFGRMEVILQELIDGFEADLEIFDTARGRLETLIIEEDKRVEQDTLSATNHIEQKERLALAKTVAQAEIKLRVRISNVPVPVLEFLIQQWVQVLLVVHVVNGEDSDAWKNALETMDLLIWSAEPKPTLDDRRELAVMVPEVRQRIAAGLKMVEIEDAVRSEFFVELRDVHAGIIGNLEEDGASTQDAAPAPDAAISDSVSALQPESGSAAELSPAPVEESAAAPASEAESEPASVAQVPPAPVVEPTATPVSVPDLERATASASVPIAEPAAEPAADIASVPVVETAAVSDAKIASVPDLEITQAPAVEVVPVPAVEPATAPAFALDLERATAPASVPAAQAESASVAELLPGPVVEPAATPVPVANLEFAPAPAAQAAPVPVVEPAATPLPAPDLDLAPAPAPAPAAEVALAPVVEPAATPVSAPDLEFTTAPTPTPAAEPVAPTVSIPDLEFAPASAAEVALAPVMEPAATPVSAADFEFATTPTPQIEPAPAAEPAATTVPIPDLDFAPAAAPAPVVEIASTPVSVPDLEFTKAPAPQVTPAPAAEPAFVLELDLIPMPAAEAAPAPAAQAVPGTAAESGSLPELKFTPVPAAESAAEPSLPELNFIIGPATQPAPAPVTKPTAAPAAPTAAIPATKSSAAPTARPAPTPAAQRVTAPPAAKAAATPAVQPHPESTAKASAAPIAPKPAAQRVAAPSASKPAAAPAAQPAPAPSAKPSLAPGAQSVSTSPAKPAPVPGKGVPPAPRSPVAPQSRSVSNASASLDFTAPVTVQNPFGGGKVQVEDLDFTAKPAAGAAGAAGAKRDATPAQLPANLAVGTWVGIREKSEKDPRRSAKLSYISPLKTRYLFVDRQGKTMLDCSRAELASRFQIGEIVIMDKVPEVPLFDRITEGLVGKLGGGKTPR